MLIPLVVVLLLYPHYVRKSPTYFWKRNQRRTVYVPRCRPSLPSFDIASVVGWFNCTHFFRTGINDTNLSNSSSHVNSSSTYTAPTSSTLKIIHPHLKQSQESNSVSSTTVTVHTYSPSLSPLLRPSLDPLQGHQSPHSAVVNKNTKVVVDETSREAINKTLKRAIDVTPKEAINKTSKVSISKTPKGTVNKTGKEAINKTTEEARNITPKRPMEATNKTSEEAIIKTPTRVTNKTQVGATNKTPKGASHICELISKFEKA